ncbi:hypothetical protein [Streptomyces abikoensis]|uniref:hypothetical protein n=1 Tax=Streptomyces abikoensis TaxID=97398 RepID=UPI001674E62F|nr:hypothetical protein [Streptomyces abikoensis]GGP55528.1 hypothetical protein GCM10010214_30900 [Streptomyces abikoensis]
MREMPSKKPGLSVSLRADGLCVVLRADQIRHETITGLVAQWQEPGAQDDVEAALEDLADLCRPGADEHAAAVDSAVEAVEDAACMGYAETEISLADAVRLRDQLNKIIAARAVRSSSVSGALPRQRGEAA